MNYHYLTSTNETAGPASLEAIRALARSGQIPADPMVRAEGSENWQLLSTLASTASATSAGPQVSGTILADFVEQFVDRVSGWLSPAFVARSLDFAKTFGHFAVLAGAALTLLYAIFAAVKYNSFALFLSGLGFVIAIAVAQFAAKRFLGAADVIIAHTPSRISSAAFLECAGLLLALGAIAMLISGIATAIQLESFTPFVSALFIAAVLTYAAAVCLHPAIVSVETGPGTAGEEAIGLITFFLKAWLKLVPLFFFLLAVGGALALLASFTSAGQAFAYAISNMLQIVPLPIATPYGLSGSGVVLLGCVLPLLAYFVFLLQYLLLDVLRAILAVPGKLDALRTR